MNDSKKSPESQDELVDDLVEEQQGSVEQPSQAEVEQIDNNPSEDQPETASVAELQQQIATLTEQLSLAKDQSLRAAAEVENIRRRASNEQISTRKFAIEGFATELLAVKDSLDLAEKVELSADNSDVIDKMKEGLGLTLKQLDSVFEKFSIKQVAPEKGDKLDPELHQAMTVQPSDEVDNNCIVSTIQNGYQLHDRLLRPAMVIIARTPEQKNEQSKS